MISSEDTQPAANGIDALIPRDIARKAEVVGARKVRLDTLSLLALALLASVFIGAREHVRNDRTRRSSRKHSVRRRPSPGRPMLCST